MMFRRLAPDMLHEWNPGSSDPHLYKQPIVNGALKQVLLISN